MEENKVPFLSMAETRMWRITLESKFGLTDHPKAQEVWDLAWEIGSTSGYVEIKKWYAKFAGLVK